MRRANIIDALWIIDRLRQSQLIAAFSTVFSGNALGQLIMIAAVPALSRLYSPEAFGIFASLATIIGIIAPVSGLSYERAIPLVSREREAANLALISLSLATIASLLLVPVAFIGAPVLDELEPFAAYIVGGVFCFASLSILQFWTLQRQKYLHLAVNRVIQSASMVGVQLLAGLLSAGAGGLIFGHVIGALIASLVLCVRLWHDALRSLRATTSRHIYLTLRRFRRFPALNAPATLITAAGWLIPPLVITAFYSAELAGIYFMAERLTIAPTVLIGQSAGQAFYRESAGLDAKALRMRSIKVQIALGALGVLIAIAATIFAKFLLVPVLGAAWLDAEWAIIWMGLTVPPMLSIYPVAHFNLIERQDLHLVWSIIRLLLTVTTLLVPLLFGIDGLAVIFSFACGTALSYFIMTAMWHVALCQPLPRKA